VPDFTELKQRQAAVWSAGAFEEIAVTLNDMHVALVEALGPQLGEEWLDVGCGSGNLAELAAGAGAHVTGLDLSPRLIEVAEARAEAAGLHIHYRVGDAENLDLDDTSVDVVVSSVGMIFAPDHDAVAHEVARVVRTGGRLGFSAWTPEGTVGDMFKALGPFQPPPPPSAGSPLQWGSEVYVREKLGDAYDLHVERRTSHWEDESLEAAWETFSTNFGPVVMLLARLEPERREEFRQTMLDHMRKGVRPDGTVADDREYLLVTGVRR
jgi:ubiquinone/menaquinone biosynthesis C-methylase UbiE